jgi:hypothetical protein
MKDRIGALPELIGLLRAATMCLIIFSLTWGFFWGRFALTPKTPATVITFCLILALSLWIFVKSFPAYPRNSQICAEKLKLERVKAALLSVLSTSYLDLVYGWFDPSQNNSVKVLLYVGFISATIQLWQYQLPVYKSIYSLYTKPHKNS